MTKSCNTANSEALRAAVVARSTEPSLVESWCPNTMGRSLTRETALYTLFSCSGFNGLK